MEHEIDPFQSDMWSFGVTLWEVFSLGAQPYANLPDNDVVVDNIRRGVRLSRPDNAHCEMYELDLVTELVLFPAMNR